MHNTRYIVAVAVVALVVSSVPVDVSAAPSVAAPESQPGQREQGEAKALRAEAEEHFFRGDFEEAAQKFERAFSVAGHASDLFNAGRVYEEKGDIVAALERYEQFAQQPRVPLEDRAVAAKRIEVLRVLVEERGDNDGDEKPSTPAPAAYPSNASMDDPRPAETGKSMVVSGVALLGLGSALAVAGGVGFGLAARRNSDKVNDLSDGINTDRVTLSEAERIDARGRDFAALQITFLVAGGATAAVGAGLLAGGLIRRKYAKLRAVAPTVGPHTVGVNTLWRF